jgi:S1-C subfamily serine protease
VRTRLAACLIAAAAGCASPQAGPNALGITVSGSQAGVVIDTVDSASPAAIAGLHAGDILLRYNGAWVTDEREARRRIRETVPGTTVELEFLREGKVQRIFVPV